MERTAFLSIVVMLTFIQTVAFAVRPAQGSDWSIENAALKVTVSEDSGRVTVLDKKANHLWKQAPTIPNRKIKIVKADAKSISFSVKMKDDSSKEIPLTVTLTLLDKTSALQVDISADPKLEMSSFDFLEPFAYDSENAFLAIADWCNGHIYPCNLDEWPGYNLDEFMVNFLLLPWAAVVDLKSGLGYSVTIETADDALIRCVKFGNTRAPMVKWMPQMGRFGYERRIIYTFASSGGYVALAKEFRKYARKQGWLVTLKEKAKSNPNINRLFGAAILWDYFKHIDGIEAYNIGVEKAIHHVSKWDNFYNYPRVFEHDYYRRLEDDIVREENALGWLTEEYIQLADAFPISDTHLLPNENYDRPQTFLINVDNTVVLGWRDERGQMSMRCSAFFLRRAKQSVGARLSYHPINSIYFDVSTQRQLMECYSKFHPRTRTQYKNDIIDVLKYLKSLGLVVHGECAKWWTVPYQDVGLGTASILTNLPWPEGTHPAKYGQTEYPNRTFPDNVWQKYETWGTLGHRYRVPLWELVFHDCIISTQRESDTMDWTSGTTGLPFSYVDKKIALSILFGTMPTYYHCIVPESAGAWTRNRLEFIRSYRNACKPLEILADKEMVNHEFLTESRDVHRTTWSDGTQVVCNFGEASYTAKIGDKTWVLPPLFGWVVKGPQIEASMAIEQGKTITRIRTKNYYFTDEYGAQIALKKSSANMLRVNADYPGQGELSIRFRPLDLDKAFSKKPSEIWQIDPATGKRVKKIDFSFADGFVQVGPFQDWVVLDVLY